MFDWGQVNWAEVVIYTVAMSSLLFVFAFFLSIRMERMASTIHLQYLEDQRTQLRAEYERVAKESHIHQDQLREVVRSVVALAETVKTAICSHEPVDEDASRSAFSHLEGKISELESYHKTHPMPRS